MISWIRGASSFWGLEFSETMRISSSKKEGAMASLWRRSKVRVWSAGAWAAWDTAGSRSLADGRELRVLAGMKSAMSIVGIGIMDSLVG